MQGRRSIARKRLGGFARALFQRAVLVSNSHLTKNICFVIPESFYPFHVYVESAFDSSVLTRTRRKKGKGYYYIAFFLSIFSTTGPSFRKWGGEEFTSECDEITHDSLL